MKLKLWLDPGTRFITLAEGMVLNYLFIITFCCVATCSQNHQPTTIENMKRMSSLTDNLPSVH